MDNIDQEVENNKVDYREVPESSIGKDFKAEPDKFLGGGLAKKSDPIIIDTGHSDPQAVDADIQKRLDAIGVEQHRAAEDERIAAKALDWAKSQGEKDAEAEFNRENLLKGIEEDAEGYVTALRDTARNLPSDAVKRNRFTGTYTGRWSVKDEETGIHYDSKLKYTKKKDGEIDLSSYELMMADKSRGKFDKENYGSLKVKFESDRIASMDFAFHIASFYKFGSKHRETEIRSRLVKGELRELIDDPRIIYLFSNYSKRKKTEVFSDGDSSIGLHFDGKNPLMEFAHDDYGFGGPMLGLKRKVRQYAFDPYKNTFANKEQEIMPSKNVSTTISPDKCREVLGAMLKLTPRKA
jgi:hypothetical protein